MVGYRRTHSFPAGKPFPLTLLSIARAVVLGLWVFLVSEHWLRAIPIIAAGSALAFINSMLIRRYERTGQAVRIPRQPRAVVRFPFGLPFSMFGARIAFFVTAALMIMFGVIPVADSTARTGIIACVFGLVGVAVLNIALENYDVKTGHAKEVEVPDSND